MHARAGISVDDPGGARVASSRADHLMAPSRTGGLHVPGSRSPSAPGDPTSPGAVVSSASSHVRPQSEGAPNGSHNL
jgi:hypothetical protein